MWRKAAAVCLVAAPIALTVATGVDPALGDDQGYGIYRQHPDAVQWHAILLHWAWVLFVPGFLGLLTPIRQRGAVLARIAWVATILGLTTFSALMASDFVLLALEQNLPDAQVALFDTKFEALLVTAAGWQWPGLLGWGLALVLTPIAAARGRVIDWWTAGAALAGTALYLLFAISPVPINLLGPIVLIGAYGTAAWRVMRPRAAGGPDSFGDFRRAFGRMCLYAAPLSFAAGMATVPDADGDFASDPLMTQVSALLLHLGWVLFVPAVLHLAARANRFTQVAAGVTVLALINFSGLMLGDSADLAAHQAYGPETAKRVSETLGTYSSFAFGWAMPGMVLTLLGLIAVAVGTAVSGAARWWHAAMVAAGVVAFLGLGLGPIGVTGPLLMLAGFALMAREPAAVPAPPVPVAG
ncbi:hypothetical protein GCM10010168_92420 [Actinoplanes ianthinogenes]|uniref:Uncharacterized protein n=2 Tax=Actinoplanes ianthinogenes TaxID=122358 RepID=A0ABM7LK04_9ACTN|nr:hypothetical protein Aiant_02360 [Actinoplanes ianthinogenes]GGR58994.1 hypothetical protein GCM10010168_92420 [Actinoplanes ianthinogenes]